MVSYPVAHEGSMIKRPIPNAGVATAQLVPLDVSYYIDWDTHKDSC
jgi:hypothetical protein